MATNECIECKRAGCEEHITAREWRCRHCATTRRRIEAAEEAAAKAQEEAATLRVRMEQSCRAEDTESATAIETARRKNDIVDFLPDSDAKALFHGTTDPERQACVVETATMTMPNHGRTELASPSPVPMATPSGAASATPSAWGRPLRCGAYHPYG